MEWIEIALGNLQGREVLLNEGVKNEEDDNVTLLAWHSPRGGRDVDRGRGRGKRRGREISAPNKIRGSTNMREEKKEESGE